MPSFQSMTVDLSIAKEFCDNSGCILDIIISGQMQKKYLCKRMPTFPLLMPYVTNFWMDQSADGKLQIVRHSAVSQSVGGEFKQLLEK